MPRPRKIAPAPAPEPPTGLSDAQRAMIDNASSDAARAILIGLFAKAQGGN